ncbi:MAG: phosphoribosylglycinamide formyltransferase [Synergistaceae bacterium]|jgi:formyltetrahydrofolate-dependent phosphoribosylglycinamide formyltransferase|nr:phosphoribosylglycinamide formyltransferase [Synergistaceae bacterium]
MKRTKPRLAVLISGTGSNMEAIAAACRSGLLDAEIAVVISDNPNAAGLSRARKMRIETVACPYKRGIPRGENEIPIIEEIRGRDVDWIVLAGYMKILTSDFVRTFPGRVVNIHPSLLPAFPGAHAIRDALDAGADFTGVTIHIVDELVDHGPIIAQEEVVILPGDTEETLASRIHAVEHKLYPRTLQELIHEDI